MERRERKAWCEPAAEGEGLAAAGQFCACRQALAGRAGGVIAELTDNTDEIALWRHYPEGEVYDPLSHAQYFYHMHPPAERPPREHGHFHIFMGAEGLPPGASPLILPEDAVAGAATPLSPAPPPSAPLIRGSRQSPTHLVAIAVDPQGEPIRLFTTNRWVTAETWCPAADLIPLLDCFPIARGTVVDLWVSAVIGLYRRDIAALLRLRDKTVMAWRWRRRTNVFDDRRLEIPSSLDIDIDSRLAEIDAAPSAP